MTANAPWYPKHGIQPTISRLLLEIGRSKILFFLFFFKKVCLPVTLLLLPCLEFSLHLHPRLDHLHRIGEHACRRRRLHKRKNKVSEVWMGKKRLKNSMLQLLQNTRLRLLCCHNAHVHVHSVTYSPAAQEVDKEPPFLDRLLRHAELWCVQYCSLA